MKTSEFSKYRTNLNRGIHFDRDKLDQFGVSVLSSGFTLEQDPDDEDLHYLALTIVVSLSDEYNYPSGSGAVKLCALAADGDGNLVEYSVAQLNSSSFQVLIPFKLENIGEIHAVQVFASGHKLRKMNPDDLCHIPFVFDVQSFDDRDIHLDTYGINAKRSGNAQVFAELSRINNRSYKARTSVELEATIYSETGAIIGTSKETVLTGSAGLKGKTFSLRIMYDSSESIDWVKLTLTGDNPI